MCCWLALYKMLLLYVICIVCLLCAEVMMIYCAKVLHISSKLLMHHYALYCVEMSANHLTSGTMFGRDSTVD